MKVDSSLWHMRFPKRAKFPLTKQGYEDWETAISLWENEEPK